MIGYLLSEMKLYRRLRKGKWQLILHRGIMCEAWFRNRNWKLSIQEIVLKEEEY